VKGGDNLPVSIAGNPEGRSGNLKFLLESEQEGHIDVLGTDSRTVTSLQKLHPSDVSLCLIQV
jgi:hypothetical protein